jgi:hypothetical protein
LWFCGAKVGTDFSQHHKDVKSVKVANRVGKACLNYPVGADTYPDYTKTYFNECFANK